MSEIFPSGPPCGSQNTAPRAEEALEIARAVHMARRPAPEVLNIMRSLKGQGMSHRAIARELNRLNIKTGRGCQWYGVTVKITMEQGERSAHGW